MSSSSATCTVALGILIALAAVVVVTSLAMATRGYARARSIDLQRRTNLNLAQLSDVERERFAKQWADIQGQFVDDPIAAVAAADSLVDDVMQARGYVLEAFDQRLAEPSAYPASVTRHYRAARSLSASIASDQADTDDLRRAEVHYRKLFAQLLSSPSCWGRATRARTGDATRTA